MRCIILAPVLLLACAPQVRTTMIGAPAPPAAATGEVQVYATKLPECPFDEIALVSAVRPDLSRPGMEGVLDALKQRAQRLGGHALVGLTERPRTEAQGPSLAATVIRFTSPDCTR